MKYKWLEWKKNKEIIVFFNGWGMDESVVNHLNPNNYDVVMFYDYNSLETDFDFAELQNYEKKNLVSWSMGVMVATLFNIDYDNTVAINGTLCPIDDEYGIPKRIYELTIKGFNEKGRDKFVKYMFDDICITLDINRDFENQKSELAELKKYSANKNFHYDKIWLSDNDKIIPTKNQEKFWNIKPNLSSGHCPFFNFKKWEELL